MTEEETKHSARPLLGRVFLSLKSAIAPPPLIAHVLFWPITLAGITLDLWSKKAVFDWLSDRPDLSHPIIDGFLTFVMVLNNGAVFGIGGGRRLQLIAVSVVMLVAVVLYFAFYSGRERRIVHIILALFTAGICGNLYDRIFNDGLVRDFIDVAYWPGRHWPAFNVADSLLCIAVGLVLIMTTSNAVTETSCQKHPQQQK